MPIIELDLVIEREAEELGPELLQRLADQIGDLFGSDAADTWVRVRYLHRHQYAENRHQIPESIKPTFVSVLRYELPAEDQLVLEARQLAGIVASCTGRPLTNTHITFEPDGRGRVAFGGELVR